MPVREAGAAAGASADVTGGTTPDQNVGGAGNETPEDNAGAGAGPTFGGNAGGAASENPEAAGAPGLEGGSGNVLEPVDPPVEAPPPSDTSTDEEPDHCVEPAPTEPEEVAWEPGLDARPKAAQLSLPTALEASAPGWVPVEAFPGLTFTTAMTFDEPGGLGKIFVSEQAGRLYAFDNDPGATEKHQVLDISAVTQSDNDSGLLGVTFHPEFGVPESPNRGYVYMLYAYSPSPIRAPQAPHATVVHNRLSRFTIDLTSLTADPASELVLIEQMDQHLWHQGGGMFFNPKDGFLYVSFGDEGGYLCGYGNCQVIDKDLFSGVIRIDVDMRGGDVSHPIINQPDTGSTANYYIPNDNPFVGQPGVLEEFYAIGLRSPHRMSYDRIDDITWIGDVGQSLTEELDVLQPGANFQWSVFEGSFAGSMAMPTQPIGVWTNPVMEFIRWDAACIIGGYVYRGSQHPYLYGKYVFGDYVRGKIYALSYAYDGVEASPIELELLAATPFYNSSGRGISSFGIDKDNELYFLTVGESKIQRLARTDGYSNAPLHLSETGVFTDTANAELTPDPGLIPYAVTSPLWSDGARKSRWLSVPDGTSVGFAETGSWSYPEGTVFVKHFDLVLDERQPDEHRRLETRVLVHGAGDVYYGLTYKWNEAGTDADLLLESQREPIDITLADGSSRHLEYFYPGPNECNVCHNPAAGSVLGPRTLQLNHDMVYPDTGRNANQVFTWSQSGLLDVALDEYAVRQLGTLVDPSDDQAPLETRVRSYWAGNCSMCHGSLTDIRANWNARFEVPLQDQGVVNGVSQSANDPGALLVTPGYPESSVMFLRSSTTDRGYGMPPLGRSVPDPVYVDLLAEWICSLAPESNSDSCFEPPTITPDAPPRFEHKRTGAAWHRHHRKMRWHKPEFRKTRHSEKWYSGQRRR